jgi:L-asparaginase
MKLRIITTGGTIDKVYFDETSRFEVGDSEVGEVFERSGVGFRYSVRNLFRKDSLALTDEDRQAIRDVIADDTSYRHFVVTHGTDTMTRTAAILRDIPDKVIVLTGSLEPSRFRGSSAIFNIGCAVGAVQVLDPGVYIAMNGRIFDAARVRKNPDAGRFEDA